MNKLLQSTSSKKWLTLFLAAIIFTTLFTGLVLAQNEPIPTLGTQEDPELTATIIEEDRSRRGEFEKHFLLSDGTYLAGTYDEPIHMLQDDKWIEIDNTLELTTLDNSSERYVTREGLFDASFSRTPSDQLVNMESNGYTISWGLQMVGDLTIPGKIDDQNHLTIDESMYEQASIQRYMPDESVSARVREVDYSFLDAEEQKLVAEQSTSQLSYEKVFGEEIDVNYFVLPTRIKEEIILNTPQHITAYVMTVTTELDARLLDNRQIEFYHEDDVIFTMWAPYMYDTVGELSEDIAVDLNRSETGTYEITMSLDTEWLKDSERIYPVVLDPDVTVSLAKTNGLDNYVWEGQPTVVQDYNKDRMYIGRYRLDSSSPRYTARTYQKYDVMPTIPSGSTITAATQTFKLTSGTSTGAYASAYRVTGADWSSKTITWNNKPAAVTSIAITGNNISQNGNFSELKLNMLSTVNAWYSGSTTGKNNNYGVMVRYQTETVSDYNAFYSADVATESSRPKLVITYTGMPTGPTTGISSGRSYMLKNNNSRYFMDVYNHQTTVGTGICQYTYTGATNQQFILQYQSSGEYTIRIGEATNRYVAVDSSGNVVLSSSSTAATSRWYIVTSGTNYRIINKSDTTKYLGATSGIVYLFITSNTSYVDWNIKMTSAFSTYGGLSSRTVSLQRIGATTSDTTWLPLIQAACSSWNSSGAGTNISTTTNSSNHTIIVDYFPLVEWDGYCTKYPLYENVAATYSTIEINTSLSLRDLNNPIYNPPDNPNRLPQLRQAAIAHEIGHLLWLADYPDPPTGTRSLMVYSDCYATTNWIFKPQTFDRNNVNWRYD